MLNTPVLFLVFNRPNTTQQVFEAIRQAKPKQLFIAADGPRTSKVGEAEKCSKVREIATQMDWDCEIKTLFRKENLGCGKAVSAAINWFFEHVEEGIILEDDTLPSQSFFKFCEQLLEKYRHQDNIMHIGGCNVLAPFNSRDSYFFSKTATIWGWATWRRAWKLYDFNMTRLPQFIESNKIISVSKIESQQLVHIENLKDVATQSIDTWDIQWTFSIWDNNGLAIISKANLVSNIGFGIDATHTKESSNFFFNCPTLELKTIEHPEQIVLNQPYDEFIYNQAVKNQKNIYNGNKLLQIAKNKLKALCFNG